MNGLRSTSRAGIARGRVMSQRSSRRSRGRRELPHRASRAVLGAQPITAPHVVLNYYLARHHVYSGTAALTLLGNVLLARHLGMVPSTPFAWYEVDRCRRRIDTPTTRCFHSPTHLRVVMAERARHPRRVPHERWAIARRRVSERCVRRRRTSTR
jgi:hypothetical protein